MPNNYWKHPLYSIYSKLSAQLFDHDHYLENLQKELEIAQKKRNDLLKESNLMWALITGKDLTTSNAE